MASDVEIGRNLARIRGALSQKDLADAMRARGFRWSQATVWAVEKGERPLRLSEAEAVGRILDVHHAILLSTSEQIDFTHRFREFTDVLDSIEQLAYDSFEMQRQLALFMDWNPSAFDKDDDPAVLIVRTALDAAAAGLIRAEAHYRGLLEVTAFPDTPDDVPSAGRYSDEFMKAITQRLAEERAQARAAREKEDSDGIDKAT
ncbi:helix-turn-helix domain-containing protein [Microbacterium insulae]|uniref:Helix-turn-helix domain-containing protein n=1 Tax=Microbacterium insulae TaxID=483014 RepID=A0ABW3AEI0_9MICO